MVGHGTDRKLKQLEIQYGLHLISFRAVIKVIDIQAVAYKIGITRCPEIGSLDYLYILRVTIDHTSITETNIAYTMISALLMAFRRDLHLEESLITTCSGKGTLPIVIRGRHPQDILTGFAITLRKAQL
ncbi:hypothetical protein CC78DRAFT_578906 [Lojkania enalia]|uniref:Uncharacterized protein n=1 Tax=Lojkania enalia TaxID=147567 RepID=A0A9P4N4H7_9PLEO|nr:hypothetical protein CC78DRAFT_578906 [Didymosphaeria enalia]